MTNRKLNILLLQARLPEDPMGPHELECFTTTAGLNADQVTPHDLLQGPPSMDQIRRYDALMIGGSGDFYVSKGNLPHFEHFLERLIDIIDIGFPTFASCFGYQSTVRALGGEVCFDPERTEVGTYELTLTEKGQQDPLFESLPISFMVQMGHKDRAICHPDGLDNLATTALCPLQAFRIGDKPIWAAQFHPELDKTTNLHRFEYYLDGYAPHLSKEQRAAATETFGESPEASGLLTRFLDLVFG